MSVRPPHAPSSSALLPHWATRVHQPRRSLDPIERRRWTAVSADPVWRGLIDRIADGALDDADERATAGPAGGPRIDLARFGTVVVALGDGILPDARAIPNPLPAPLLACEVCATAQEARATFARLERTVLPKYAGTLAFLALCLPAAKHPGCPDSLEEDDADDDH
jgi:hypothetical protein